MRLVVATANPDKAAELGAILEEELDDLVELVARPQGVGEVEETGESLEDNARLKAVALVAATGEAAVADDTGLEVVALGGAPGTWSARFAGEAATYADNVAKLLAVLEGEIDRRARFRTVVVCRFPDGTEMIGEGVVEGEIVPVPRGFGGFGYDPVFVPEGGGGRTFAEMSPAEKHELSHRGLALRCLAARLKQSKAAAPASSPRLPTS
jgi:XTP/dITP diphosphohydrolase